MSKSELSKKKDIVRCLLSFSDTVNTNPSVFFFAYPLLNGFL